MYDPEAGVASVEYSLLVALIAAVIIGVVVLLGPALIPGFQTMIAEL